MIGLFVILALVLANALFSGAEIAVLTVRRTRLAELVDGEEADLTVEVVESTPRRVARVRLRHRHRE